MTAPGLPPGVALVVPGLAREFAGIRHDVEEATRRQPLVVPPSSPPETHTGFTAGAFAAGWANFGAGYQPAGYEVIGTRVFLRGLISPVAAAVALPTFSVVLTLKVGVRPSTVELFPALGGDPITLGRIDIYPNGQVQFGGNVPLNGYVTLSGITFSTL